MYHCFCAVASTMCLRARSESLEEVVNAPVENHVATPEVDGEDDRGHDDHDGRADHLIAVRPGDFLHLRIGFAEEVTRGEPPFARLRYDRVRLFVVHDSSVG